MRILLINPNTSESVTDLVAGQVRRVAGSAAEFVPVTARFGARYIASRAALAIAGHAALDCLADHAAGCDAVYLACFGDPGLHALREVSPVPVVGMVEASCQAAARIGRFGIVTGGASWRPILAEMVGALGLSERFVGVHTVAPTGGEIARAPQAALPHLVAACRACVADGAEAVILGGAALAGLGAAIRPEVAVPVLCSVEAATRAALDMAAGGVGPSPGISVDSVGLGPALARMLVRS